MSEKQNLAEQNETSSGNLLRELVRNLTVGLEPAESNKIYKGAVMKMVKFDVTAYENDSFTEDSEFNVVNKIKDQISKIEKKTGNRLSNTSFDLCHGRIVNSGIVKNRSALYKFLLTMSQLGDNNSKKGFGDIINLHNKEDNKLFSTPSLISNRSKLISQSSGYVSQNTAMTGPEASQFTPRSQAMTSSDSVEQLFSFSDSGRHLQKTESITSWGSSNLRPGSASDRRTIERPMSVVGSRRINSGLTSSPTSISGGRFEASETILLQELVLCFQGIEGRVIKRDSRHGFKLDPLARVPQVYLVRHLMELGYLHNRVRSLGDNLAEKGVVSQGLAFAVRANLTDYYRLVAEIHNELQQGTYINEDSPLCEENHNGSGTTLTLKRLFLWAREPIYRMQIVCDILQACLNKSGGAVVSAVYNFSHHGDPFVRDAVMFLLSSAIKPLFMLICHWMINGELLDPHDEFFVAVNYNCQSKDRWRHKFVLREPLIPSMMSKQQAELVLNAGKCVNFLSDYCQDLMSLSGNRQKLQSFETKTGEHLLELVEPESELWDTIEATFLETSRLTLDVLIDQFKLFEHFRGLKMYMLLGQGDFYRYFLELLHPELKKSATVIYQHNLAAIMETAIRQTNAQYEDPDITDRVCIKLFEPSTGEDGWSIFGINYNFTAPLDSVFCHTELIYRRLFNFLLRLKMDSLSLSHIWKHLATFLKMINRNRKKYKDLIAVTVQVRILTGEMLHYLHQVEYYIMFEVLECTWSSFAEQFQKAVSLEQVIDAHESYLDKITTMTFQDSANQKFSNMFRIMNSQVLDLHKLADDFLTAATAEYERQVTLEKRLELYGTNYDDQEDLLRIEQNFYSTLASFRARTRLLTQSYQETLKKLLLKLSSHQENNLQLLSSRLDFNEFYKRSDVRLSDSMKFSRTSDLVNFSGSFE